MCNLAWIDGACNGRVPACGDSWPCTICGAVEASPEVVPHQRSGRVSAALHAPCLVVCCADKWAAALTHTRHRFLLPDAKDPVCCYFCDMAAAAPGVPDGLKVDTAGRVWCVGSGGIWVVAPSGEVIGVVQTPEVVRNLAFGGPDFRTLYLTPGGSLATLEVTTPGIGARSA